jgi:hypothetical protein
MVRSSIPSTVKDRRWRIDCGNTIDSNCQVCNIDISYTNCHVAHVISVKNGGNNNINNLRITCMSCNLSMSTMNLNEFKELYFDKKQTSHDCDIFKELYFDKKQTSHDCDIFNGVFWDIPTNQTNRVSHRFIGFRNNPFINFIIATHLTH